MTVGCTSAIEIFLIHCVDISLNLKDWHTFALSILDAWTLLFNIRMYLLNTGNESFEHTHRVIIDLATMSMEEGTRPISNLTSVLFLCTEERRILSWRRFELVNSNWCYCIANLYADSHNRCTQRDTGLGERSDSKLVFKISGFVVFRRVAYRERDRFELKCSTSISYKPLLLLLLRLLMLILL